MISNETLNKKSNKYYIEYFIQQIKTALETKNWPKLESTAKRWIEYSNKDERGFLWLARSCLQMNKHAICNWAYTRVHDLNPLNQEAVNYFSVHKQLESSGITEEEFTIPDSNDEQKEALLDKDTKKHFSIRELELAQLYFDKKLFANAKDAFHRAYKWIKSEKAAIGKARSLSKLNDRINAQNFLRKTLLDFPRWHNGRIELGKILFEQGYKADAQREWQTVLKMEPNNVEALRWLKILMLD